MNFSQIGQVVFPETCLQAYNMLPTNWTSGDGKLQLGTTKIWALDAVDCADVVSQ